MTKNNNNFIKPTILPNQLSNSSQQNQSIANQTTDALVMANFIAGMVQGNQSERALQDKARVDHDKERREQTKGMSKSQIMKRGNNLINREGPAKINRALLQSSNSTELSESCLYLIDRLRLDNATKEALLDSTQKLISEFTSDDIEEVNKYLTNAPGGDVNKAAEIITKNFQGSSKTEMVNLLEAIHNNSITSEDFIDIITNCAQQNSNLTHSPTIGSPTPPTNQPTSEPTPMYTPLEQLGIGFGGIIVGGLALICCICTTALALYEIKRCIITRKNKTQVAPEDISMEDINEESKRPYILTEEKKDGIISVVSSSGSETPPVFTIADMSDDEMPKSPLTNATETPSSSPAAARATNIESKYPSHQQ